MAVRVEKTFRVKEPVERVWALLKDPRSVANFVPGAKITETVDERNFKGAVSVKVGPTVTDFKGELHIERLDDQHHEIEFLGKGHDVRGKGSASMKMTGSVKSALEGGSEVKTISEVNVVGILAQLGGRMIQDVSDVMFREFVQRFETRLGQPDAAAADDTVAAEPVNAVRVVSSALGRSVRRVFRGDDSGEKS
jgi:carbon monoxide dehydrogenase subunit G